jgi:hypothetical protein
VWKDLNWNETDDERLAALQEKAQIKSEERKILEELCLKVAKGESLEEIIDNEIARGDEGGKKAKILSENIRMLRELKNCKSEEEVYSDFCLKLMKGTSFEKLAEWIAAEGNKLGVRVFQNHYDELNEMARRQEKEVYANLCESIKTGTRLRNLEREIRDDEVKFGVYKRNLEELTKLFEAEVKDEFVHLIMGGESIVKLRKMVKKDNDRIMLRVFLRDLKNLQKLRIEVEAMQSKRISEHLAYHVLHGHSLETIKEVMLSTFGEEDKVSQKLKEAQAFVENYGKLHEIAITVKKKEKHPPPTFYLPGDFIEKKIKTDDLDEMSSSALTDQSNKQRSSKRGNKGSVAKKDDK